MGAVASWLSDTFGLGFEVVEKGDYIFMGKVLMEGLPQLTFKRVASHPTKHTSGHLPISREETNKNFGILRNLEGQWCVQRYKKIICTFLGDIDENTIKYSSETDIQIHVKNYLENLLKVAGLKGTLHLLAEGSICGRKGKKNGSNRADYWLVVSDTGRPIIVVEVKSPDVIGVLDDACVVGQTCDYMLDAQSFFGYEDIFAISTTLQHWKFLWFPHSSTRAESDVITNTTPVAADPSVRLTTDRVVNSTRTYIHTDPDVSKIIISMFHKSLRSRFTAVELFDAARMYIQLTKESWLWHRLKEEEVALYHSSVSAELRSHTHQCANFTILKYFYRLNAAPRVWLTVAGSSPPTLIVLKQIPDPEPLKQELDCWRSVNQAVRTFTTTVNGVTALCMPLVIHAQFKNGKIMFDFDLTKWSTQDFVIAGQLPVPMRALSDAMEQLATTRPSLKNALYVMNKAVDKAAAAKIEHKDLEWRHVALMPVFEGGRLVDLSPILIDFGAIHVHDTVESAKTAMLNRVVILQEGVEFE